MTESANHKCPMCGGPASYTKIAGVEMYGCDKCCPDPQKTYMLPAKEFILAPINFTKVKDSHGNK